MKTVLDIEVPCMISGMRLGGFQVPLHRVPLVVLDNGSIMAYCPNHRWRSFIGDITTVQEILKVAKVVRRIEKPLKEKKYGST